MFIGAGALGNRCIPPLHTRCEITVVDGDSVEERNLGRQPLFDESDLGTPKVKVLKRLYPSLRVENVFVDARNVKALVDGMDLVVDLADDLHLTGLLAESCGAHDKPLLIGAVHRTEGQVYALNAPGAFKQLFRGKVGQEQDGCDMDNVPQEVIDAVAQRVLERITDFLENGMLMKDLDLYSGGQWIQLDIGETAG